jgi:hypothetical protein
MTKKNAASGKPRTAKPEYHLVYRQPPVDAPLATERCHRRLRVRGGHRFSHLSTIALCATALARTSAPDSTLGSSATSGRQIMPDPERSTDTGRQICSVYVGRTAAVPTRVSPIM